MLRKERTKSVTGVQVDSKRTDFWNRNPRAGAIATKMIRDRMNVQPTPGDGVAVNNENAFYTLLEGRASKNLDAETIMALQPDIKLIRHMITSVMMSPIDMDTGGITHGIDDTDLPGIIYNPILDILREHFSTYIDLDEELTEIIPEALFDRGSAPRVVVPEAVIDDMINRTNNYTVEDYQQHILDDDKVTFRPIGILGDVTTRKQVQSSGQSTKRAVVSMENAFSLDIGTPSTRINDMVSITDNISVLKLPILKDRMRKSAVSQMVRTHINVGVNRAALEAHSGDRNKHFGDIRRLRESLYARNSTMQNGSRQIAIMQSSDQASRSSIGHPLVVKPRSSSLVPVFTPGSPDNHIGYVMALDGSGYPIDITADMKDNLSRGLGNFDSAQAMNMTSTLIQQTQILNSGYQYNESKASNSERIRLWAQIFEENIFNRMKNGILGANIKMGRNEDFYNMILARNWANETVHMVFIPVEQVAYFAYEYDDNGMGKSLLDGVTQTSTLRIMTNFANFMASVNNAVGRTKVAINIDSRSPDPEKDLHIAMDEYLRSSGAASPTEVTSAADMFRTLRQMGVCFEVQGHPGLPNTTVDVEAFQSNKLQIDQEFTNQLRNEQYMGLYVTPDMVDMTQQGDFAITRWTSNQLFTKRIMTLQRVTCRHAKKYVETYTRSDGELIRQIQASIRENLDKLPDFYRNRTPQEDPIQFQAVIDEFFRAYRLELPSPNSTLADTATEQITKQASFWDAVLEHYLVNELADPLLGDGQKEYIETMTKMYKSYFMRKYIEAEGLAPEILDFMREGSDDNPALNMMKESGIHWASMTGNIGDFIAAMQERREMRLNYLEAVNPKLAQHIREGGDASDFDTSDDDDENTDGDLNNGDTDNFTDDFNDAPGPDDDADANAGGGEENNNSGDNPDDDFNSPSTPFDADAGAAGAGGSQPTTPPSPSVSGDQPSQP